MDTSIDFKKNNFFKDHLNPLPLSETLRSSVSPEATSRLKDDDNHVKAETFCVSCSFKYGLDTNFIEVEISKTQDKGENINSPSGDHTAKPPLLYPVAIALPSVDHSITETFPTSNCGSLINPCKLIFEYCVADIQLLESLYL